MNDVVHLTRYVGQGRTDTEARMQVQAAGGQVVDLASLALTTAEMALALKVSERTIQRRIASDVIPVIDLGDGRRIPGAFLDFVLSEALRTGRAVLDVLGTAWKAMQASEVPS